MNPNNKQQTIKMAQIITTIFLVLVLVTIVLFYLYYGIKIGSVENSDIAAESEVAVPSDSQAVSEKYQRILEALPQSGPDISQEKKTEILENLDSTSNTETISDEEKMKILENLQ